jgi:hypothetical protein
VIEYCPDGAVMNSEIKISALSQQVIKGYTRDVIYGLIYCLFFFLFMFSMFFQLTQIL